jgi:peptidoglycan-associated lipoprotein
MNLLAKSLLLTAALGLAACTNPNRFGGNDVNLGGANGAGLGSASDPTSAAYFQPLAIAFSSQSIRHL